MLNRIIGFSINNKLIVGLLVLVLIVYGAYQTNRLPIDAVPDITNNQVQVITVAPAYGATDIERLVTFPIEQANRNIPGIKEIRSFSRFGLSLVTIVFDDATDVYFARQQVAERLATVQTQIPQSIGIPTLGPVSTGLGEIYQYVVKPKKGYEQQYDAMELRTIQDWIVRRQLLGVDGVAEVSSFGGKLKQFEIAINPNKLNGLGVTIEDVFEAVEQNNGNTGGAYIENNGAVLYIRSEGLIGNIADIENIAIERDNDAPTLFIRDVATVQTGYATRYGAMCYNDEGEVAGAIVMMLKGANSNQVINNVKQRIAQIQQTLPEGVEIEPFLDRSKMVRNAIGTVETNLAEGALIVVFVLVLFLGNLRAGLLVASVIPLSMLFAVCMMNLFGVSGNLMSLGALDFGLIVDGAVIIVEAVMHQLHYGSRFKKIDRIGQRQMDETVKLSAGKMMNSAVFGQVIILVVYLPIFALQGIEGKMFKPMAQTVAFALVGAFLLSLTYIPMMSTIVLSKKISHKENLSERVMRRLGLAYQASLAKALRHPKLILGGVVVLLVAALLTLSSLGGEFIPTIEEGDFAVETRVLPGSSLNTTIASTQQAAHILVTRFPEVEKVVTKIGSGEVPTDPMPMDASDLMVILKDKDKWTSAKNFDELASKMGTALKEVPGVTTSFQYPVQMRFNELISGARQDVVCKIFGENLDTLAAYANALGRIVNKVEGAANIYVEPVTGMPQLLITYDRASIARYKLRVADVNRIINTAFAGQSTGLVFEDEKRFELVVRLDEQLRQNLTDVGDLLVPVADGQQIPLRQLARVEIKDGPYQIQREDARRRIVVGFNADGRDVQSLVEEVQAKAASLNLPAGYYITYGGAFENLQAGKQRLMIAVPVALLLIFILLFFAFGSIKHGLLIYSAIPLSAIGGIFFLALRGMPFSISAGIGFIALFGVSVLNGIVMVAEFKRLQKQPQVNLWRVVLTGSRMRLRPVLMTAFVASLGFLPMSISMGAGAEVQRPLATVVIGGLLVATLLTLYVLPLLYIMFEKGMKAKPVPLRIGTLLFAVVATSLPAIAQQGLSLDSATSIALANNRTIKIEKLRGDYARALIRTAADIPKTNIGVEAGQLNSFYTDTRFSVVQSFALPGYYNKQKNVYQQTYEAAVLSTSLREFEVRKAVAASFYQYQYLRHKEGTLMYADTLFRNFYNRATLRLQKGETNVLEKATAENQLASIQLELLQVRNQLEVARLQFQLLLNINSMVVPIAMGDQLPLPQSPEDEKPTANPLLSYLQQQKQVAAAQTTLQKAKLQPEVFVGYFNNSFRGTGADDKQYPASSRFHSAQVGVSVPVFSKAQKQRVRAYRLAEDIAEGEYQQQAIALEVAYNQARVTYTNNLAIIDQYRSIGFNNATLIVETANRQFAAGEINYLDWVNIVRQAISIRLNYVEALRALNESVIELNYLQTR